MKQLRSPSGFTLIEVLIVVAIIGAMALIASPSLLSWLPNLNIRDASQDKFLDIQFAKTTAIKRNSNVVIVIDKKACGGGIPEPGGGYTIFVDDGSGGGATANDESQDGTEETLRSVVMPKDVAICSSGLTGDLLAFQPTGIPKGTNSGIINVENINGRIAQIEIYLTGAISIK